MRISDWSSDVCSSDLIYCRAIPICVYGSISTRTSAPLPFPTMASACRATRLLPTWVRLRVRAPRNLDRKSVVWGKSVSVRLDLGGRRIIKKKKKKSKQKEYKIKTQMKNTSTKD